MKLKTLPVNDCEFALARIAKASEQIRKINNRMVHPVGKKMVLSLVESMAVSMESILNYAGRFVGD